MTGDSPIRDLSNLLCIAEVVRRFDVIAVQEVRRSAQAFVFDRQRVRPSGLACELVVAAEDAGIPATNTLQRRGGSPTTSRRGSSSACHPVCSTWQVATSNVRSIEGR